MWADALFQHMFARAQERTYSPCLIQHELIRDEVVALSQGGRSPTESPHNVIGSAPSRFSLGQDAEWLRLSHWKASQRDLSSPPTRYVAVAETLQYLTVEISQRCGPVSQHVALHGLSCGKNKRAGVTIVSSPCDSVMLAPHLSGTGYYVGFVNIEFSTSQ